jgi:acyl-CoA hydrolase
LLYVALDDDGNAVQVPALIAESLDDERRMHEAEERQKHRLAQKKK